MVATVPANALCIGCNYPLRGLTEPRCPECGRPFDLVDRETFNSGRPLTAFDRLVLRPIGVPTFAIVIILCGMMLWVALDPSIYYMMIHWFLLLLQWEI